MGEELKPCSYCGEPFEIVGNDERGYLTKHLPADGCVAACDGETGWVWEKDELIKAINARPIEDALRAELEASHEAHSTEKAALIRNLEAAETEYQRVIAELTASREAHAQALAAEQAARDRIVALEERVKKLHSALSSMMFYNEASDPPDEQLTEMYRTARDKARAVLKD